MKKLLVLFLVFSLACSKDETPSFDTDQEAYFLEAIIGSWSYETVSVDGDLFQYPHTDGCEKDFFQFYNQEGKLFEFEEQVILNCESCAECATSSTNLNWELRGDIIDMYFGEQLILQYRIIEVTENKFSYSVNADLDNNGEDETYEYTGVPYDPFGDFN
jgi:hypothetical protein